MTTLLIIYLFKHAVYAHYLIFGALLLAGLNIPFSEDLLIVGSALIASIVVPQNVFLIYIWLFLGCYLSDVIAYFMGRTFGPKLWKYKWFKKNLSEKRLKKMSHFIEKYGFLTFFVGRLIPFGIRNCLFLTVGMSKMKFSKFAITDAFASLFSSGALFYLTYTFGKNYKNIYNALELVNIGFFSVLVVGAAFGFWFYKRRKKQSIAD